MDVTFEHAKEGRLLESLATRLIRDQVFDPDGSMIINLMNRAHPIRKREPKMCICAAEVINEKLNRYELVGSVFYFPTRKEIHIYVKPKYRRKGIAQKLLDEIRREYKLERTVLFSWGAIGKAGAAFFKRNFIHVYIQSWGGGTYEEQVVAATEAGFKGNVFKHMNANAITKVRTALREQVKAKKVAKPDVALQVNFSVPRVAVDLPNAFRITDMSYN